MFLFALRHHLFLLLFAALLLVNRVTPFLARLKGLEQVIVNARNRRWVLQPKQPHEIPYLDVERVEAMTRDLEALGFQCVGDFACLPQLIKPVNLSQTPAPLASPFGDSAQKPNSIPKTLSFLRFFLFPASGCAASIVVTITLNQQKNEYQSRWGRAFHSYSDSPHAAESWSYETTNWKKSDSEAAIGSLFHRSRVLKNYLPDLPPAQLWAVHQQRRDQIAHAGGFSWKRATLRDMENAANADFETIANTWETMTPLQMTWLRWRFKREKNPDEWLGEVRGKVPPLSP